MLRQRTLPVLIGAVILISIIIPIFVAGFSSLNQAEKAQEQGDLAVAADTYAHAAKILFWRKDLYEQAGISAAQAGEGSKAIEFFKRSEKISEEGWVWYCTAYIQTDQLSFAASTCLDGTNYYDSARLYRLLAYIYQRQKDWVAERFALENQTRLDTTDAYAAYRLGLLLTLYTPEDALPELIRASSLNPEVDSAVQTLRAALAVSQQQSSPSMQKVIVGQAFGLVQDWELARVAFEQAVKLDEKNAEAWAWLGETKQQLGGDGSEELNKALSLGRNIAAVHALRGLYWSRQGRYQQVLAEYLLAAGIEPENPRWQVGIGEAYTNLGDLVAALDAYQHAVKIAPEQVEYWRLLAVFCAENSVRIEDIGLPAAQQAVLMNPNDPSVLDALGYVYLSTGRFASAEETLKQAVEISPQYFPAHIHLALTYLSQGNQAAAFNSLTYVRDAEGAGVYAEAARQLLDKYFR
ncbi:MAG: tetratricopeptide repeat protein [Anaerolineales bacterium]|nr:tetratricopeptide repeat protein [Anaerolineales bacterium]